MESSPPDFEPLDPSDFAFYGFDQLWSQVEPRIRGAGIRRGEPRVTAVEGGVVLPPVDRRRKEHPAEYGGVVTAAGQPVETAQLRWEGVPVGGLLEPVAVPPTRERDEEVVFLGWRFDHFGHFLLESLARVWFLREVAPTVPVVLLPDDPAHPTPEGTLRRILEAFGVPPNRILAPDAPTRFRRVIVPEPLFELRYAAHERLIRPYRDVASRLAGDLTPSAQPVYLSRRLLGSRYRPIVGEGELEDVLRENGFAIAHPETMAFEDQVRLFNGHTDIFSCAGSAAHNVLFARYRPRLHLLTAGDFFSATYFLCSKVADAPTTFVNCLGMGGRSALETRIRSTPLLVEMPKLVAYLDERGFLHKRVRATLAGRNPALRDQYEEAWLYAWVRSVSADGDALPSAGERDALRRATSSWPLSGVLAWHYALQDDPRATAMVEQFVDLVATEFDVNRLAHYRADIAPLARQVAKRCGAETFDRLAKVAADRYLVEPELLNRLRSAMNRRGRPSAASTEP